MFIQEDEIRKDYEDAKNNFYHEAYVRGVQPIVIKREVGQKYGLDKKECTKTDNIINAILEYLREIRKTKHDFSSDDISDFYRLSNSVARYDKLSGFLMLESGTFVKYLLDHEYNYLLSKGINKQILDNILTTPISSWLAKSIQVRFWLERYKSIKKYYDETYGEKNQEAQSRDKLKYDLENKLVEETYDLRLDLEQYLEDFIRECPAIYKEQDMEKISKIIEEKRDEYNEIYREKHYIRDFTNKIANDVELNRLKLYIHRLHTLYHVYSFFNNFDGPSIDEVVSNSIDHFNESFDKLCSGTIVKQLMQKDVNIDTIEISGLEENLLGYYFVISYNDKDKLYVNFKLCHENLNYLDKDAYINDSFHHINFIDGHYIDYEMSAKRRPDKGLNEEFDFNVNLAIDDFDDMQDIEKQKIGKINHSLNTREQLFNKYFVDLGLPSGTLWGRYNIGATNGDTVESWYGNYYAWGELEPKSNYDWGTYKYANGDFVKLTKYCVKTNCWDGNGKIDKLKILLPEDDIAVQTNNLPWEIKMPTKQQLNELIKNTNNEWVENYNGVNGLNGRIFISKINGNELFIPAAGYRRNLSVDFVGEECSLWCSDILPSTTYYAWSLSYNKTWCGMNSYGRHAGFSVRPVLIDNNI